MNAPSPVLPRYVLMRQHERIGPSCISLESQPAYTAIYAFSDKIPYDAFVANSGLALTPYPLVKRYLREQCDDIEGAMKLVVIDAASSKEPYLMAVTMRSVLEALDDQAASMSPSYRLRFEEEAQAYRVENV
jgi:hypothetical protein